MKNILHSPNASANLLSIQCFCVDNDCHFILNAFEFWVKDNLTGRILLHSPNEGGLYLVHLKQLSRNKGPRLYAFIGIRTTWPVWHSRLGHPSSPVLHKIVSSHRLPIDGAPPTSIVCQPCQMAKSHKLPFPASNRNSTSRLALIQSDVWTSPISSLSECHFYVLFIDNFSRFS